MILIGLFYLSIACLFNYLPRSVPRLPMLHFLPTFFVSFWIYGTGVNNQRGSTGVVGPVVLHLCFFSPSLTIPLLCFCFLMTNYDLFITNLTYLPTYLYITTYYNYKQLRAHIHITDLVSGRSDGWIPLGHLRVS